MDRSLHLQMLLQVDTWLRKDTEEEQVKISSVRNKLEEAHQDNRDLKMKLQDTTTNLGLLRSELAQSRFQYEEKCQELHT